MEKNRRIQKNILELTLERLKKLYKESSVRPRDPGTARSKTMVEYRAGIE